MTGLLFCCLLFSGLKFILNVEGYDCMVSSLTSIFVADIFGVVLVAVLLAGNRWLLRSASIENRALLAMVILTMVSCGMDCLLFAIDKINIPILRMIAIFGDSWLYVSNLLCAFLWLFFLTKYACGGISKWHMNVLLVVVGLGLLGVLFNLFYPFIFSIDETNTYHRYWGYWLYTAVDYLITIDSIAVYFWKKSKNGVLRIFPIGVYLIPLMIGTVAQTVFYGVSAIAASLAISMAGVLTTMQTDLIFKDGLTGLYNRIYLDHHLASVAQSRNSVINALMLNMKGLKIINEKFGHAVGDEALKNLAKVLQKSMGDVGVPLRYSGDEFIVLLNTRNEAEMNSCLQAIDISLEKFNEKSNVPYELAVAVGSAQQDLRTYGVDGFINTIHTKMRENKSKAT